MNSDAPRWEMPTICPNDFWLIGCERSTFVSTEPPCEGHGTVRLRGPNYPRGGLLGGPKTHGTPGRARHSFSSRGPRRRLLRAGEFVSEHALDSDLAHEREVEDWLVLRPVDEDEDRLDRAPDAEVEALP